MTLQMLMSVKLESTIAVTMLTVLILWEASVVHVRVLTLAMDSIVQVTMIIIPDHLLLLQAAE